MVSLPEMISSLPPHTLWLLAGLIFLGFGMLVGEPGIAALGIAAMITAIAALSIPVLGTQILLWGILSIALAVVMRGLVPKESLELKPSTEAAVSATIPSGGVGEVSYEGTLWTARCQISDVAIAKGQTVYVISRQGNTLIVLPSTFPDNEVADRMR